jgi:hypothetical protein
VVEYLHGLATPSAAGLQFLSSARHGVRIDTKELGNVRVTPVTEFQRLQPSVQPPLFLVEQ